MITALIIVSMFVFGMLLGLFLNGMDIEMFARTGTIVIGIVVIAFGEVYLSNVCMLSGFIFQTILRLNYRANEEKEKAV